MPLEVKKYLSDIQAACQRLTAFTAGKSFRDYENDELLQAAVERQFEIIGEALNRLLKVDADLEGEISDAARIIAF